MSSSAARHGTARTAAAPRTAPDVDVRALEKSLRRRIRGEVRFDDGTRAMYAVDASNYRQVPLGVVVPRSVDDVVATVATCREVGAPIVSRGGGTSLAGQTCNVAVVIDWSKYVNRIREVDVAGRLARVEPGVICDDLVHAAAPHRLTYAPDPATHTHCCFGGMLGNNSCGVHAQMAGKAVDNTEAMDVLLYDGTRLSVGWMDEAQLAARARLGGRQGDIYRRLRDLRVRYEPLIRAKYPKLLRRVSGYNLDQLLPDDQGRFNVARALVGSESTCVTILEATVRLVYNHPERVLLVLGYPDIFAAADHIPLMREYEPIGLEGIDARLIQNIQIKGGPHREYLADLPEGKGFLLVEFGADTQQEAAALAHRLMTRLERDTAPPHMKLVVDRRRQHEIWEVRESGLGATAFVPGEPATWPGWEDSAVPVDRLGDYLRDLRALYDRYDLHPALYGHFGMGCVHCRVAFELTSRTGIARYRAFMDEATDLCVRYGGSFSGEHGDGQSRAEFLAKMFGEELVGAFREFKAIWDPDGRMNPGKIVDPYRIDENLRLGADYHPAEPATHFRFPQDGGSFANATLRCVGVGKCRRLDGEGDQDTMCPSFMVTREEKHTTRGRAHALWEMLHGDVIGGGWRDGHVKEALDLCLACKGCKGDCPVNVDMATYKAEFLSHYWKGRLRPRYAYAFGLIDRWAALASVVPGLANLATQLPGLRAMAKLAAGMPAERQIPPFAPQSFQRWFRRTHPPRHAASGRTVVLWPDTFNNYFFPETARAAVDVLESGGWAVDVPRGHVCCGRPLYDYGMLDRAKRYLRDTMACLRPAIEAGTSLVVLEPSCAAVFRDELHGLFPDDPLAKRLVSQTLTLAEFLERHAADFALPRLERRAVVQGHCHQKAIMRLTADRSVLQKLGMEFEVLESGCCGMAGSFGYERDKYPVSIACGERVVLPAVRREPESTMIVADGFSCREQIAQATDRQALHLAEVIELAFDREQPPADGRPERRFTEPRRSAIRRSMWRTALAALAIAGVAGFVARSAAASWMRR